MERKFSSDSQSIDDTPPGDIDQMGFLERKNLPILILLQFIRQSLHDQITQNFEREGFTRVGDLEGKSNNTLTRIHQGKPYLVHEMDEALKKIGIRRSEPDGRFIELRTSLQPPLAHLLRKSPSKDSGAHLSSP